MFFLNKKKDKLVKLAANYLARPYSQSINNSIKKGLFPENPKVASVTTIDKKTNKNSVLNFRPISILSCLLKVYENTLKTQLVEKYTIYFSLLSLRIENRTTRKNLDNNYYIEAILMDLSKAFDCIPMIS